MSKAILVLDKMPIGCLDCKLHIGIADFAGMDAGCYCLATGLTNHGGTERGARCPLEELPEHDTRAMAFDYTSGYAYDRGKQKGWNDCLDAIEGKER